MFSTHAKFATYAFFVSVGLQSSRYSGYKEALGCAFSQMCPAVIRIVATAKTFRKKMKKHWALDMMKTLVKAFEKCVVRIGGKSSKIRYNEVLLGLSASRLMI